MARCGRVLIMTLSDGRRVANAALGLFQLSTPIAIVHRRSMTGTTPPRSSTNAGCTLLYLHISNTT